MMFRNSFSLAYRLPLANSKGSGETARMRRLTWTFAIRICYNDSFPMMQPICTV